MNVLVLNCGSSPVKFQLIATDLDQIARNTDRRLAHALLTPVQEHLVVSSETLIAALYVFALAAQPKRRIA
ncbi:MAG: hypothetical protein H0T92_10525 [Pyrinomonadaceae bacterium]|nr:hypothetical protein [Pyrinomonadaceae bacterium]